MDKAVLYGKGSSDPRATFKVPGTAISLKSSTQTKTTDPTWKETFEVALPKGPEGISWDLEVTLEDVDKVSSADAMGSFKVPLAPLADHKVTKAWYPLEGSQGEVYLVLQWRHNPDLDFSPFEDADEKWAGKEPNELRIAAVQALGLAVADKNLLSAGACSAR